MTVQKNPDYLLTAGQVAALFGVSLRTVSRWAARGLIDGERPPGGRWRFRESKVRAALREVDRS